MTIIRIASLAVVAVAAAACTQPIDRTSPTFGNAVRQNMQAHIVNPGPRDLAPAQTDGRISGGAYERYTGGGVEAPADVAIGGN
jgi:hypothetical protein